MYLLVEFLLKLKNPFWKVRFKPIFKFDIFGCMRIKPLAFTMDKMACCLADKLKPVISAEKAC